MRCLVIHQQILDEPSQKIHEEIKDIVNILKEVYKCDEKCEELDKSEVKDLSVQLHLEIAHAYLNYSQVSRSEKEMKAAFELMDMEVSFIGALGKRTFFQQKELPQLTIDLKVKERELSNEDVNVIEKCVKNVPYNIPLNDEVSMDGIHFSDPSSAKFPQLSAVQQAALLALFVHLQKSRPKDELQNEELTPYLTCLLSQPRFWSFQTSALRLRSLLEKESSRRVDRSLKQLEVCYRIYS
ncbi:tetratricopeptide repeat protein 27-like, partial [Nilaparvata lugens]|uniref:tetratricopeptide repeat protein 27-like n=1 Tax=Nilaparvata lugens TaxID=108931 RepID=UPI00193CBA59